jgi:hypothetical protein
MNALKDLSDAATPGLWYTVDTPWGDGTWIVAGNPDPHAGTMVCDCQDMNESRPEDSPTAQDDAAFIAALVSAYRAGRLKEIEAKTETAARAPFIGLPLGNGEWV